MMTGERTKKNKTEWNSKAKKKIPGRKSSTDIGY